MKIELNASIKANASFSLENDTKIMNCMSKLMSFAHLRSIKKDLMSDESIENYAIEDSKLVEKNLALNAFELIEMLSNTLELFENELKENDNFYE